MVFVNEGIPQAFGDILVFRQFGTGFYGENSFGNDFLPIPFIQGPAQFIDLVFPQIRRSCQGAGQVAVEGAIAYGHFRFIGVAGEDTAEGGGECGKNAAAPVPGLHVFFHESGEMDFSFSHRKSFQGPGRFIDEGTDGNGQIGGFQMI